MEEKELLKERLQAITDKRRIQEYIAEKRRRVEEEKLQLQYIKKKALRDQWLTDGSSGQSEEEREAARLRAQDERQRNDALQGNVDRMEKEIEALEAEELNISANEELVLKRLKEVERTAEDIIKGLSADSHAATFAMEASAQREQRTGICQAGPAAAVSPESRRERASGPSEDGRERPRARNPEAAVRSPGETTPERADELVRRAADEPVASDPLYHRPIYSAAYFGTGGLPGPPAANDARRRSTLQLRRSPARPPQEPVRGNGREEATPNDAKRVDGPARGAFAAVKVRSEARPTPLRAVHSRMESSGKRKAQSDASTDVFRDPTAVTMIFMGYENAPEEEEADCHAELVTVGCSDEDEDEDDEDDDDDDKVGDVESKNGGELLSYHPEGYRSKVFRPEAAKSGKAMSDDAKMSWDHLAPRKPTFIHKSASRGPV